MSLSTRSGFLNAYSVAHAPPKECPTKTNFPFTFNNVKAVSMSLSACSML